MTYSGASQAKNAREMLGNALAALQEDPNIPPDVLAVAQNIAQAVGALFEAERASSEPDGKGCVRHALSSLSQTLALLQDVRAQHRGIAVATETLAKAMSTLYPLTTRPSRIPPAPVAQAAPERVPAPAPVAAPARRAPQAAKPASIKPAPAPRAAPAAAPKSVPPPIAAPAPAAPAVPAPVQSPVATGPREAVEANIGATTESNFFVGFSGEIAEGGVFIATYSVLKKGTPIDMLVTLPGGFETRIAGTVRFVRDPMDMGSEFEPGMGVKFDNLTAEQRELILRFIRKRPPMFYDE